MIRNIYEQLVKRSEYWFGCLNCGFKPHRIEELSNSDRWSVYRNDICFRCKIPLTKNKKEVK